MAQIKYTVKAGDTLSGIGAKYGLSYADSLKSISGYKSGNANLIYSGEVLTINTPNGSATPTNAPPTFNNTNDVQNYLNSRQNDVYSTTPDKNAPKIDTSIEGALKAAKDLLPTTPAPEVPNLVSSYNTLRETYGVTGLEQETNDIQAQIDQLDLQYKVNRGAELGKPVAQGVIEGRITQEQRDYQENRQFLSNQLNVKTNQLKSAYGVIDTIMNLTQKDFENAKSTYNDQFDQAYKMISVAQGIQKTNIDLETSAETAARANAQILVNAITSGNLDLNSAPASVKTQLSKLELESGLPMGFFSSIKKDPKADIISTTSNNGQIQVLMRNADGTMSLQTYGTANAGGKSEYEQGSANYRTAASEMTTAMSNASGSDGYVSPDAFRQAAKQWVNKGFDANDFYQQFSSFANPSHIEDYGVPDRFRSSGY